MFIKANFFAHLYKQLWIINLPDICIIFGNKKEGLFMADIFGTILTVGDFLKNDNTPVKIRCEGEEKTIYTLARNRVYIIPDYQREIRWVEKQLSDLTSDISQGDKFLGNIIVNKHTSTEYEIIDGQQRITILLMLIHYIRFKFNGEIDIPETCLLKMANFDKFDLLVEHNFSLDSLAPAVEAQLKNSDVFNQRNRYVKLWNQFEQIDFLSNAAQCAPFLTNVKRSRINLIVNENDTDNYGVEYFLDVNVKGVKLDPEDVFKGYLFSKDSSQTIRDEWRTFKIQSFKLNEKTTYETTKLIEHYLSCNLCKDQRYKNLRIKEDFSIHEIELNGIKHNTGEHIIKTICNNAYMLQSMKNINKFLAIMLDILKSDTPTEDFKSLFNPSAEIDHIEKTIIHNFIRKIMLDELVVPKILIMKYVIEVLFDKDNQTKKDYRKIYGVYLLAIMFIIIEGAKDVKKLLGVVKDDEWYKKAVEQSKNYFSLTKISKTRIEAQYKLIAPDDEGTYMFRCKSLSTIYNYFVIHADTVEIADGQMNELKEYLSNSERFSDEHFIINKSGKFHFAGQGVCLAYPSVIKKYANSIFNFIFINRLLNTDLGTLILPQKIILLDEKLGEDPMAIECAFSKMIFERSKTNFSGLTTLTFENTEAATHEANQFFENEFIQAFSTYASDIITEVGKKLGAL